MRWHTLAGARVCLRVRTSIVSAPILAAPIVAAPSEAAPVVAAPVVAAPIVAAPTSVLRLKMDGKITISGEPSATAYSSTVRT
jgi:hypothetical protein